MKRGIIKLLSLSIAVAIAVIGVSIYQEQECEHRVWLSIEKLQNKQQEERLKRDKEQGELWVEALIEYFEKEQKRQLLEIEEELRAKVALAYKSALEIEAKYRGVKSKREIQKRIKELLLRVSYNREQGYIFLTDYSENSLLLGSQKIAQDNFNSYLDADNRSIVLEEIQKVRKHGEGLLQSRVKGSESIEMIFVKDLDIYEWFIGTSIEIKGQEQKLKKELLALLQSYPRYGESTLDVFQKIEDIPLLTKSQREALEATKSAQWYHSDGSYYYIRYYKKFDWYILYGFRSLT